MLLALFENFEVQSHAFSVLFSWVFITMIFGYYSFHYHDEKELKKKQNYSCFLCDPVKMHNFLLIFDALRGLYSV
ncbi:hypothetical protein C7S20_07595 [Christiangramia fulva]|uniref:Uncharacterized protein n=1 Tax=Christiangramia fulva TaxID=2126553 RepID=A0A2R3Z4F4_9FLAO|nr:hypothetical protein C7S20_07595 [Christiangramia fulva]